MTVSAFLALLTTPILPCWNYPGSAISNKLMVHVVTGIAGGVMAVVYALWNGCLGRCLDSTGDLLAHFVRAGIRPHRSITLDERKAISIPYAPAIAIGTLFSFLAP